MSKLEESSKNNTEPLIEFGINKSKTPIIILDNEQLLTIFINAENQSNEKRNLLESNRFNNNIYKN